MMLLENITLADAVHVDEFCLRAKVIGTEQEIRHSLEGKELLSQYVNDELHKVYTGYVHIKQLIQKDNNIWYIILVKDLTYCEDERKQLIQKIKEYDKSEAVNSFTVNGYTLWLDKATRAGLELRFRSEKEAGVFETTLWYDDMSFTMTVERALEILYALECYASKCYDTTMWHLKEVKSLSTVDQINQYDYTTNYPEKLMFEI